MLLKSKELTRFGALIALSVVLIILAGIIETNTLFLLALAAFGVGIAVRETGLKGGGIYLAAAIFTALIATPNKIYAMTYSSLCLYLYLTDLAHEWIAKEERILHKHRFFQTTLVAISAVFALCLLALSEVLFVSGASPLDQLRPLVTQALPNAPSYSLFGAFAILVALLLLIIHYAHNAFQVQVWERVRGRVWR